MINLRALKIQTEVQAESMFCRYNGFYDLQLRRETKPTCKEKTLYCEKKKKTCHNVSRDKGVIMD